ncbi:hypothetical protein A6302_03064 [Methylobrevis pamukkalensis]|uniref:Uncharacterized protein n=1 Tax=Methylobrevis pamukkalensis TaxID=1439726 RepID=A0A1E3H037_9HYPH|nr:hypothetical protein A6302_03064 [Methylobrevis pamukkalensis]
MRRLDARTPGAGLIRSLDRRGAVLDERSFAFAGEDLAAEARIDLPQEMRNEIARIEVAGADTAGAVQLLDDRWRRRSVGLVAAAPGDRAQPLLSPAYFLGKALGPYADIRQPRSAEIARAVDGFIEDGVSAIVMADVGTLGAEVEQRLEAFVRDGGALVRFAGPRLAASNDELVPVPLREGGRTLGGALSWEEPQKLASFSTGGPFAGLPVPGDVTVERQVLAEPGASLDDHSWASLEDGTPLVTGTRLGSGWLVLYHVTADTTWSNLPISGVFVEMLRRSVALGHGGTSPAGGGDARCCWRR